MDGGSANNAGAVNLPTAMDGGSANNAGAVNLPTAMDGGSANNAGAVNLPTAMDGRTEAPPPADAGYCGSALFLSSQPIYTA